MNIVSTSLKLIGNTPLLSLNKINPYKNIKIYAKAEMLNNGGSIKDRIASAMISDAEQRGLLKSGGVIIEATSGNTGIGLAWIAAVKKYQLILTMPDSMSIERRKLLQAYGAQIVLTSARLGMQGAVDMANQLAAITTNSFLPKQFENQANVNAHYKTTGPEIWHDTKGRVDAFIAGVGTGGTITGVGKYLKEKNSDIKIIAVEPKNSPVLSGGEKGAHSIQGIGAGFLPKILDTTICNEIIVVSNDEAKKYANLISKKLGVLVGISSGANIAAAFKYAKKMKKQISIVTILPDTGERYLSTNLYN